MPGQKRSSGFATALASFSLLQRKRLRIFQEEFMKTSLWISFLCFSLLVSISAGSSMQEDVKMPCRITGEGPPIVLVPGGLTGWVSWDSFVPHFSKEKKVVQVQLLNVQYGLENKPLPHLYSVSTESKALEAALSAAHIEGKADFIGWSYGGLILLDYALNHPEKIRTLTLIEPPALWIVRSDLEEDPQLKKAKDYLSSAPGTDATITDKDLEEFLAFAGFSRPGESVRNIPQWNNWQNFKQSLRCNSVVLKHDDDLERLRNFAVPVLLIKGTGSAYFLHRIIDGCQRNFPQSQVVEFPGGHAPHLVSRDQFLEAVELLQK